MSRNCEREKRERGRFFISIEIFFVSERKLCLSELCRVVYEEVCVDCDVREWDAVSINHDEIQTRIDGMYELCQRLNADFPECSIKFTSFKLFLKRENCFVAAITVGDIFFVESAEKKNPQKRKSKLLCVP